MSPVSLRRIACVQVDPIPGEVGKNIEKVKKLTKDLVPGTLDMLVLPEMALTGYIFSGLADIEHLLEDPYEEAENAASPTLQLARQLAARLDCYVVIGFPMRGNKIKSMDKIRPNNNLPSSPFNARPADTVSQDDATETRLAYFNAALLVNSHCQLLHVFMKHFSYENDKVWACEGPGFQYIDLPRLGRVCIAICMDLNPYDFKAPFESFELASYCLRENVDILVMPMAWLVASDDVEEDRNELERSVDTMVEGPHEQTINYWALRLSPLLKDNEQNSTPNRNFYFVNCNRTGTEQKSKFAGSSCALRFGDVHDRDLSERPVALLGAMGRQEAVAVFPLL
ncbi:hypothetical protein CBS101457_006125 [Exobasidium rhododendri]|nr:hypothetical protein CBS101457_006125 [Exobasidium rhododendri]